MSPQDLNVKAQDSLLGGGMGHGICFQPSGGFFYLCEHMACALEGLWESEIISLPGLPIFRF